LIKGVYMETSNAEITTLTDTAAADAKPEDASGGDSATPVKVADTSEDTSNWTEKAQKRYDELTRKTYEALGERDRKDYENQSLRARLAELEKAKTTEVAPPETFPTLEQHGYDEGKYQAAVAAHFSKIAREQGTVAAREAFEQEQQRQRAEKADQTWAQKQAEFVKSKPDYAEKVTKQPRDGGPVITKDMFEIIRDSDKGPEVAYYLAENVAQSAAIAQLPPIQQAREIGRIEAKLELAKLPPKPAVSQAPPPVGKVDSDDAATSIRVDSAEADQLSDKEWTRRRNAQEQARLRKLRNG
jgi:hypothetical protein